MTNPKRLRTLSEITIRLLASGEGQLVDYKRTPDGIIADDLVSFANSAEGGTILAGVDERSVDGAQVGVVRGCDVGDNAILQLLNKAISCLPPVSIDVAVENLDDKADAPDLGSAEPDQAALHAQGRVLPARRIAEPRAAPDGAAQDLPGY